MGGGGGRPPAPPPRPAGGAAPRAPPPPPPPPPPRIANGYDRLMYSALSSRKSSMPCFPNSRPIPDCL